MKNYFVFDKLNTLDYQIYAANKNRFEGGGKVVEVVKIPGRNGTLSIEDGSFENVPIIYSMYCSKEIIPNISAMRSMLGATSGYKRLEDSFDPDYYMRGRYVDKFTVSLSDRKNAAFQVRFDCDPRRFLKSGDRAKTFTAGATLRNPTLYDALPMIRAYGTGYFIISGVRVNITTANEYTDIDCELQEAYKGSTNCNGNITLVNGEFPKLVPGSNAIEISGITRLDITARYWTI